MTVKQYIEILSELPQDYYWCSDNARVTDITLRVDHGMKCAGISGFARESMSWATDWQSFEVKVDA